ncbi:4-phosphoerythronate dehydrogenase [candidate division BRC1 bacterium HGW-BRC1-1]|jgi:erythronate-4-phosphate dehydrogenase|nr:MAG: 4-phosphoerythronate dehydrogenase [candidate division BRC1 bacterium HGW-BRC1-1]
MNILIDENIPFAPEAFASLGRVTTAAGRAITPEMVRDVEVLIVRSITRVDERLLVESRVGFVATATIGTDHVDLAYLQRRGMGFSSAPGSNAESVTQYVTAALFEAARAQGRSLSEMSIGVVGAGNVGSRVARNARALGMTVLVNDPPRARAEGNDGFVDLREAVAADVVTLHVPLTKSGPDATAHLADAGFFGQMKPGSIFINTARGGVMDQAALAAGLQAGRPVLAVLDVWEDEPAVDPAMLASRCKGDEDAPAVLIATPHVAGYSHDGKVRGTEMVYRAACDWLKTPAVWEASQVMPEAEVPRLELTTAGRSTLDLVDEAVRAVYDIREDDAAFRALSNVPAEERAAFFDRLRKQYPVRREFSNTTVTLTPPNAEAAQALAGLGFRIAPEGNAAAR